jgi:8-oxo-dGTP pyrophosphatase MutT (NUDIX family)
LSSDKQTGGESPIKRLGENTVYQNRFITVYDDPVEFADGTLGTFLRIVESGGRPGVAMLPIASGHIGLVRTYRYALGAWQWGIPRGFAHGSEPEVSAREELVEEIGAVPLELIQLGEISPNSGLLTSVVHLFMARYSHPVDQPQDRSEVAEVRWVPVAELRTEIGSGQISDGFTLAAMCCANCRNLL